MFDFFSLCTPALIYLVISVSAILIMGLQSLMSSDITPYCVGMYKCNPGSVLTIFFMKLIYVAVWTWILQLICSKGYSAVSWFLLLFPIIIMFILIAMIFLTGFHTGNMLPTVNAWSFF